MTPPTHGKDMVALKVDKSLVVMVSLRCIYTSMKLYSYSGESVPVVGTVEVTVKYESQVATLPLIVVKGEGLSLLRQNWLCEIKLNWHEIFWLRNESLSQVLEKHN